MYFKEHFMLLLCFIIGKSKENSQDIRKTIVEPPQVYASLNSNNVSSNRTGQDGDRFCVPEMMV